MTKGKRYRVLTGINYPPNDKRAEPGDIVNDLPPSSIGWLVKDGIIEEYVPGQNTPADLAAAGADEPTDEETAAALDDEKGGG